MNCWRQSVNLLESEKLLGPWGFYLLEPYQIFMLNNQKNALVALAGREKEEKL